MRHAVTKDLPIRFHIAVSVNILLTRDGKYLLLRRANTGWADGYYTLPAGHIDGNERLTHAAVREAAEEVGVKIDPDNLTLVHVMHRSDKEDDQERLDFYFTASEWQGEPYLAEPEKSDELGWFTASELPDKTLDNVRKVLVQFPEQLLSEVNW